MFIYALRPSSIAFRAIIQIDDQRFDVRQFCLLLITAEIESINQKIIGLVAPAKNKNDLPLTSSGIPQVTSFSLCRMSCSHASTTLIPRDCPHPREYWPTCTVAFVSMLSLSTFQDHHLPMHSFSGFFGIFHWGFLLFFSAFYLNPFAINIYESSKYWN